MKFINDSKHTLRIGSMDDLIVEPLEEVDVPDAMARMRRSPNGERYDSVIRNLAPQLIPFEESLRDEWTKYGGLDLPDEAKPKVKAAQLEAQGMAPAIAAMVAAGEADSTENHKGMVVKRTKI